MHYRITWAYPSSTEVDPLSNELLWNWTEVLLYDSSIHSDHYSVLRAQLTLNSQKEAEFQFDIPATNMYFAEIEPLKGYVIFRENGKIVCKGRIDSITRKRGGVKSVSGYGNLGLLKEGLSSRVMKRYAGTYDLAGLMKDNDSAPYTRPTRSGSFMSFRREDPLRYKVQRILDLYNAQISNRELSYTIPDDHVDPETHEIIPPVGTVNEIEIRGNYFYAVENEHNINVANTSSSGGDKEDLYISKEYEEFTTVYEWFTNELIKKTKCHIIPHFVETQIPYKMELEVYGSAGRLNQNCVYRDGWNITDYQVTQSSSNDLTTILLPLGEDNVRLVNLSKDVEDATGYDTTAVSKFSCDYISLGKRHSEQDYVGDEPLTVVWPKEDAAEYFEENGYTLVCLTNIVEESMDTSGAIVELAYGNQRRAITNPEYGWDYLWVYAVRKDSPVSPMFRKAIGGGYMLPPAWHGGNFVAPPTVEQAISAKIDWIFVGGSNEDDNAYFSVTRNDSTIVVGNGMHFRIRMPYIIWEEGLKKYGPMVKSISFSTKQRQSILNYGIDRLRKAIVDMVTIDIKAMDPATIDSNFTPSVPGENVYIIVPEFSGQLVMSSKTIEMSSGNCTCGFNERDQYLIDVVEQNRKLAESAYASKTRTERFNGEILIKNP